MEPFPTRNTFNSRHTYHHGKIKEQWLLRERELKEREARNKLEELKKQVRADVAQGAACIFYGSTASAVHSAGTVVQRVPEDTTPPGMGVWVCEGEKGR